MDTAFYSPVYGTLPLRPVRPPLEGPLLLPQGDLWEAKGDFGRLLLQEVVLQGLLLRYFIYHFTRPMHLFTRERSLSVQSLIALKGTVDYGFPKGNLQQLREGQFTLLQGGGTEMQTMVEAGRECHLLHTFYTADSYADLLPLFPALRQDVKKALRRPRFLLSAPRPARYTVLDAIREIFRERYQPQLLRTYWELKLKQSLFTQLAQAYSGEAGRPSSPLEKQKAGEARAIIERDITRHYPNDELARLVNWSESSLKRAFHREYGMGMYEYLRRLRMHKARELLLQGEQVKAVAPAVGMRPSNFTMEFQKFFGYKATSLRNVKP